MFLVIFDEKLQRDVIEAIEMSSSDIEKIYSAVKKWIDFIYLKNLELPAKFASKVFMGDFWDYSMEVRVAPAIFQILVDLLNLPLWVSWADMELESEIIRLVILYSSMSKISGIPGKVIVAQFSDDDRRIEISTGSKNISVSTLFGGIAVLYVLKKKYLRHKVDIDDIVNKLNLTIEGIINEILGEESVEEELTDLEAELRKELGEL